ncbi:MAG: hypothetical protein ACK5PP_13775 [Acidimicrobiales bacterium]
MGSTLVLTTMAFLSGWLIMGWLTWRWRRLLITPLEWAALIDLNEDVRALEADNANLRARIVGLLCDLDTVRGDGHLGAPDPVAAGPLE